jgi:hypothetical protein
LRVFWFSEPAYRAGVETVMLDGRRVRIYSPEKTVVDCFKYRNKLGMDVVVEALRLWREKRARHASTGACPGRGNERYASLVDSECSFARPRAVTAVLPSLPLCLPRAAHTNDHRSTW